MQHRILTAHNVPTRLVEKFEEQTGISSSSDDPEEFTLAVATIVAQTHLSIFISYATIVLLLFLEPPLRFFEGFAKKGNTRWSLWLVLFLLVIFSIAVEADAISVYFGLAPIREEMLISIWGGVIIWALLMRTIWRSKWMDKLLTV